MLENVKEYLHFRGFKIHPDNFPLAKPGAYGIFCLSTGKWYIGISQNVFARARGHQKNRGKGRLKSAFKCYDLDQFVFFPLVYSIDGTEWLPVVEKELITTFDSFKNGYNLIAAEDRIGPYGSEFAQIVKASLADTGVRKRISDGTRQALASVDYSRVNYDHNRTPAKRAEIAASTRRAWADPKARAQRMQNKRIASAKPEVRHKISVAMKNKLNRPETKAKHSATVTGYIWITDGKEDRWVDPQTVLSKDWRLGRTLLAGRRWITDYITTKMILSSDPIPAGWALGRKTRRELKSHGKGV